MLIVTTYLSGKTSILVSRGAKSIHGSGNTFSGDALWQESFCEAHITVILGGVAQQPHIHAETPDTT
jgi:hypothetical protein